MTSDLLRSQVCQTTDEVFVHAGTLETRDDRERLGVTPCPPSQFDARKEAPFLSPESAALSLNR